MKPIVYLLIGFIACYTCAYATHLRGAELTSQCISPTSLAYTFTLTIYEAKSGVTTEIPTLHFGDGIKTLLTLQSTVEVNESITKKIFTGTHTYAAAGIYKVAHTGSNRNEAVNIDNAIETNLYIELSLIINQNIGVNNSPEFTNPPLFFAKAGEKFTDSYAARDAEGDSLVYSLIAALEVINYVNPAQVGGAENSTFAIDARTGIITWDTPKYIGNYVFVVMVEEWRKGIKIGFILRDIQVTITGSNPNDLPPTGSIPGGITSNPPQNSGEEKVFLIYPNPASQHIYIQLPGAGTSQTAEIWSLKGQLLRRQQLNALQDIHTLELQNLPRGIYFIKVGSVSKHFTRKLVLMH